MFKVNVTPEEFADLVIIFLYDKLLNPDEVVTENEKFDILTGKLYGKGLRSLFMKYYMNLPGSTRLNYKRLKKVLTGDMKSSIIKIDRKEKKEKKKEKEEGKIKKLVRKTIQKIQSGDEIDDDDLDLLIEEIMEDE